MPNGPGSHHGQAAYHHESATRHHRAAELFYDSGDHKKAAHEAQIAAGHTMLAKQFGDLAARSHLEHFGMQPGVSPLPLAAVPPAKKRRIRKAAGLKLAAKKPATRKARARKG